MSHEQLKKRRRDDYGYVLEYRTRWYEIFIFQHKLQGVDHECAKV